MLPAGWDPAVAIRSAIRDRLKQLAGELGVLAELSRIEDDDTGDVVWRLQPAYPDAAPVAWDESRTDDWAAYLTLGRATEVHVLTSPDRSADMAADTVKAHIAAVISGDFREELWRSRRTGEPVAAVGWIRDRDGVSWRPVGDRSRPLPVVGDVLYDRRVRDYPAYDPPLWDRLLAALHDRGGAYFDADETQRARGWTQTPEGARVAAEYLDIDPASAREPLLRARIEAAIRT